MPEQLESLEQQGQNCEAMPNTNADASTDAAMTQHISGELTMPSVAEIAERITSVFDQALTALIERRDSQYADAIEELEKESEALAKEYAQLEEDIRAIEAVLPAKERLTQHEADELLVSGKGQDAKAKLAELAEFKQKPVAMRQRQKDIVASLSDIQAEKHDVAKQVFEDWYSKVQPVIRSAEKGLFITLLQGLEQSFYQYQASTGTGTSDNRHRPLVHQGHITGLTADGRSVEWAAGHKWYG
jgi:hypothetical protein